MVSNGNDKDLQEAYTGNGKLINSDFLNGLDIVKGKEKNYYSYRKRKNRKKKNFISIKRLGNFKTTLLGMPYSNDLFGRWKRSSSRKKNYQSDYQETLI